MDWSTFVPTLLATFAGVIVSVILSFTAYRLWDWYNVRRRMATTKHVLSLEIADNLGKLKAARTEASNVINGNRSIQVWCNLASRLETSAYDYAFKEGHIHRIGNSMLEVALMRWAGACENFNTEVHKLGQLVHGKYGFGAVPLEKVQESIQGKLPVMDELIAQGWQVLTMMNEEVRESDIASD